MKSFPAENPTVRFFLVNLFLLVFGAQIFGERLPVKIFTSADGLGSSFVDSLMRDARGFMWFCTRDGLSRFDGSRFVTYRIGDQSSPPGIETIYESRDGIYWISTTGGSYRFDPREISPPDAVSPRLNAQLVTSARGQFLEDRAGNLWLASNGLFRLKKNSEKIEFEPVDLKLPPRPETTFIAFEIAETADGSLWINTSWGLVRRLPDERVIFFPHDFPLNGGNASMLADTAGRIWLLRMKTIMVIKPEIIETIAEPEKLTVKSLIPGSTIEVKTDQPVALPDREGETVQLTNPDFIDKWASKKIFQSSDGVIWITAENNLLEFSRGVLRLHTDAEGLPSVMARMAEDAAGNLWIGGHAGLARLDRNGMVTFGAPDGMNSSRFFAVTEDQNGTMYFAGRDFYISSFENGKIQTVRPAIVENALYLWSSRFAFRSSDGDWWFLTSENLYRFSGVTQLADLTDKSRMTVYSTKDGLKSDGMFQIFEDSGGNIWLSTRGPSGLSHGLARMKKGEHEFHAFGEAEGLPSRKSPSSYAEDAAGNIWVGFYEGGLARFDGQRFEHFTSENGLPTKGIMLDLHVDRRGRLWLASSNNGLLRIDDPSAPVPVFSSLTTAEGLTSNNIRTLTEDRFGRIYIGTASGVDRISPETGRVKHYSVNDGLAADFVVDSHCDKRGNLWFATNNGMSRLVPLPDESTVAPPVFLGSLQIAGERQPVSELGALEIEKGELLHTQNNLQIEFFALDFRAGETLRYQYKLEGADADWSAPTEQRVVTFAHLQPASYRFLVRAVNSENVTSARAASFSFVILPPVWARWWFILSCALLLGAVVVAFYRYRTARLREINAALLEARRAEEDLRRSREERIAELERVRARIATDLHDDIGASLTQIAILSEVAQAQSVNGNGAAAEPLTKITSVSNELVGTMSDIVWSINPAKDHLSDLTQRMRRFAADVLSAKGIGVHFEAPELQNEIIVNSNLRREVFLIFKEAVNNIVKHSAARRVEIEIKAAVGGDLMLEIRDDGKGLPVNDGAAPFDFGGNGISNMKKRAAELGGAVEFSSAAGAGTTVVLRFPTEI